MLTTLVASLDLKPAIIANPLICSPDDSVALAIDRMASAQTEEAMLQNDGGTRRMLGRSSCVLIVIDQLLVGILTEHDLVQICARGQALDQMPLRQTMSRPVIQVQSEDLRDPLAALELMREHGTHHLVVTNQATQIVGILTDTSLLNLVRISARPAHEFLEGPLSESVAAAPVGIFRTDVDGNCQYVNARWSQLTGLSQTEAAGAGWIDGLHPEDRQAVANEWYAAAHENRPFQLEYRFLRPNGQSTWVYGLAEPHYDTTGQLIGYIGTVTAIDELKRLEAERKLVERKLVELNQELEQRVQERTLALQHSQERLRKSAAHLIAAQRIGQLGSWEYDPATGEITWSDEVYRIFARDPELGPPSYTALLDCYPPDDQQLHDSAVQQSIATGQPYEIELHVIRPNQAQGVVLARGEPVLDATGRVVRLVGTILDITERKQAEQQLRDMTDRLQLAVRSAALGIWDWDVTINQLTWDQRMYELYGITPNEFTNTYTAWANGLHPADRLQTERAIQQALRGEYEYDTEFRVVHPSGAIRAIKAYGLVQRDEQGNPTRMIGINFDITERKQAEIQLRATTAKLQAANNELEAFAYSVSHDLRAPLRAIDGFSRALLEDYADQFDETGRNYFSRIRSGVQRMSMLIDDLLHLSRVSRSEMEYHTINLSQIIQHIAHELHEAQPERSVIWVIAPDVHVTADMRLMRIALDNLLQNAWKFTSHHPNAWIEFGTKHDRDQCIYYIRDDGAGFNMAFADKLFGVFQRLHNTDEFTGTGIGLAIVQRVIHRHGGRIWAESAIEQGATIFFTIPENTILPKIAGSNDEP